MNEKYLELRKAERKAEDKYFELRDAKSNGCLGFNPPIIKVLLYDEKIMKAHDDILKARKNLQSYLDER